MKQDIRFADDRAVSPVVGVALLIAITVILAAVIGVVVLGLGTGGVDTPNAQLQAEWTDSDDVTISHDGGEPLPADETYFVADGDRVSVGEVNGDDDLTTGESVDIDSGNLGSLDGEVSVIWEDPNSDSSTVLAEFEE